MAAHHCRVSQVAATAACNSIVDLIDAGTPPGFLIIYTGTEPTHCNDAAATEVATCTLAEAAFGAASYVGGTHTSDAALTSTATDLHATGSASAVTHFRLGNAAGTAVLQGTCSATAGDDLVLNSAIIATGSQVDITALTVSVPIDQA